ncbi:Protein kinase domain containing protein, partial [Reticulomyxa filosa]
IQKSIRRGVVEYDDDDWQHVSQETLELVKGLLEKNPQKRKTVDDILKLTWKVSSTKNAFRVAHSKFKQTVQKRKFHRFSNPFEKSTVMMNRLYGTSRDEMVM